jgi:hypothetical protein
MVRNVVAEQWMRSTWSGRQVHFWELAKLPYKINVGGGGGGGGDDDDDDDDDDYENKK